MPVFPEPPVSPEALERGEVLFFPACPFPLPQGDDRRFLCAQRLASSFHKNISYDPHTGRLTGFARTSAEDAGRLRGLLGEFSRSATAWLAGVLPRYAAAWEPDRTTLRPEEEAT